MNMKVLAGFYKGSGFRVYGFGFSAQVLGLFGVRVEVFGFRAQRGAPDGDFRTCRASAFAFRAVLTILEPK